MKKLWCFLPLVLSSLALAEQTVLLKIEGLEKGSETYKNVRLYLSQLNNNEADGSERYRQQVQTTVDKALRALGYYNTQYHFNLTERPRPQKDLLTLVLTLDKPTLLDEREVNISGELATDSSVQALLKNVPKAGELLNHARYDEFKGELEKIAQAKGYFDGAWQYHRLEVYPQDHLADWRLSYIGGERYRYGKIHFINSQIDESYLQNLLRVRSEDHYALSDLSKLSSDFSATKWFSSVLVEPEIRETDKRVDLNVLLQPKKKNEVEVGLGYATSVGPRAQLNWKKPWINRYGHSFELNSYLSKPEQSVEFAYNIPRRAQPLLFYYQFSGGVEHENQNDTKTTGAHFAFQRFWNHETGWAFSLGIKARYDAFQQAEDKFHTLLLYPTASLNRTRSDGNRFPLWGDSQKITLNWGSKVWGSDVDFYGAKASTAWVRTFRQYHRVYLRAEIGYLRATQFERIPPSLRYFAGGDLSIRGFSYKTISPRDSQGKIIGASHLTTASAEYQYQVYPNWWGALFYDTGLADTAFRVSALHSGAGIGVRWASPIGTVKFDLATPIRSQDNKKGVQFYIGIGSEL